MLAEIPVGGRNEEIPATIMKEEVEAAIQRLKKNKAPGVDNISAEEIQAAGESGVEMMFAFCSKVWEEESYFPTDVEKVNNHSTPQEER